MHMLTVDVVCHKNAHANCGKQQLLRLNEVTLAGAAVLSSHELDGRNFLGSVSDYLAHNSPCPLIVARMPKESVTWGQNAEGHAHSP